MEFIPDGKIKLVFGNVGEQYSIVVSRGDTVLFSVVRWSMAGAKAELLAWVNTQKYRKA